MHTKAQPRAGPVIVPTGTRDGRSEPPAAARRGVRAHGAGRAPVAREHERAHPAPLVVIPVLVARARPFVEGAVAHGEPREARRPRAADVDCPCLEGCAVVDSGSLGDVSVFLLLKEIREWFKFG